MTPPSARCCTRWVICLSRSVKSVLPLVHSLSIRLFRVTYCLPRANMTSSIPRKYITYRTFATPPEEDRATTVGNMSDNLMKTGLVFPEICTWIYRQTHRHIAQTDIHSTPLPLHLATRSTDSTLDSRYYFVSLLPVTDFPVCYLFISY